MKPDLLDLPKFGEFSVPGWTRALGAVVDYPVGGKLQDRDIAQAVSAGALGDQFSGRVKSLRATLAVKARDAFEVALGGFAGEFLCQRSYILFRKQRRLLRRCGGTEERQQNSEAEDASHEAPLAQRSAF